MPTESEHRPRVLCMANIDACPAVFDSLREAADVDVVPADRDALARTIPEYDAYFASLHVRLDREIIDRGQRLRAVATPSTGLDHLDLDALGERNIALLSLKGETGFLSLITSTAEMAWALLLAVVRRLPPAFEAAKRGRWARDEFRGHQLAGKTLGILGYGRLGRIVADYALAFRMRVIVNDVLPVDPAPGVEVVDLDTLLRESDVLSLHVHLTEETRHFIDAGKLSRMKPGAVLINTSRGGIVDEDALLTALQDEALGGAGLDVVDGEWDEHLAEHPLIRYARGGGNIVISPHTGGVTHEAQEMAYGFVAEKLRRFLRDGC